MLEFLTPETIAASGYILVAKGSSSSSSKADVNAHIEFNPSLTIGSVLQDHSESDTSKIVLPSANDFKLPVKETPKPETLDQTTIGLAVIVAGLAFWKMKR